MLQTSRRTRAVALLAFSVIAALATSSLVITLSERSEASHQFSDVDTASFFHEVVTWVADAGVANGFNDGTFRTGSNITRGQTSFWLANYNDAIEVIEVPVDLGGSRAGVALTADCPSGKRAIGGGGRASRSDFLLQSDFPLDADTWRVSWRHVSTGGEFGTGAVYVICAPNRLPG